MKVSLVVVINQPTEDSNCFRLAVCLIRASSTTWLFFLTAPDSSLTTTTSHTRTGLSRLPTSQLPYDDSAQQHTINRHDGR